MTESELIKCPSCENLEFEAHSVGNLYLDFNEPPNVFTINLKEFCTCTQCGYRIDGVGDLKLTTIDVYIVGDSISGRRHGLNRIAKEKGEDPLADDFWDADLCTDGVSFKRTGGKGLIDIPIFWVFTKSAWKRAENDPEFRLIEGQYAVNLQDMT